MKKIGRIFPILVITLLFTFESCKKYEDGPFVSIRTKKMRLVGEWEIERYLENGVDKTNDYKTYITSYLMDIQKDQDLVINVSALIYGYPYNTSAIGTWEFTERKKELKVTATLNGSTTTTEYKILRLTNKELWVEEKNSNPLEEYHFVKKK